jgi:hypothetical protein
MTAPMDATYALAGVTIGLRCSDPSVAGLVELRLSSVRQPTIGSADVTVEIRGPGADPGWLTEPTGPGRPVYDAPPPINYYDGSGELYIDYGGRARLHCSPADGVIRLAITGTGEGDPILATHPLLTIALLETMKRFGRFPLHAAGLSLDGRGILVPGSSGAGKSTLSVTLARAGFNFLSDDTVFLTPSDAGMWVDGFPDEVDVTETTVAMVPELAHLAGQPLRPGRDKHGFRVEDVFGVPLVTGCRPVALVAPNIVEGTGPVLEPLAPSDALLQLMPNVLLTDPAASQAHMDVLGQLVRTVPSYSFSPGSDLGAAAACIRELVTGC